MKLQLTDDVINGAIVSISGYIVAEAAARTGKPLAEVLNFFVKSNTYRLLSDKEAGLWWDSIQPTLDGFLGELEGL
jgi:hypothetical protein